MLNILYPIIWLLISSSNLDRINGYSLAEIFEDLLTINLKELSQYRGPVLKDIWIHDQFSFHSHSHAEDLHVCTALYNKALETVNVTWPPPREPPRELTQDYTMGGKAALLSWYFEEQQNGGTGYDWNTRVIEEYKALPNICGGYEQGHCDIMFKKHRNLVFNYTGIVVGSQSPWVEAAMFNLGVKKIITIEYMEITTDYPGYSAMHPSTAAKDYLQKKWELVDFAVSFSSLEHDGLGRYGDPLNPFGDLESIARIRCLLRPGGILFLGLPIAPEAVVWNAHRLYGKYRTALVLLGWKLLDIYPENCEIYLKRATGNYKCQPMMILQKPYFGK